MSTKELEVLKDICPAYAYWLISGEIQPECGHSSPEWERHEGIKIKKQLEKKTDPLNCEMCGKTITAEESALTMEKPLGARENRFLIVCHRCNVRQGKR
ncbi:hypothetical protein [Marinobacter persicus]|uniref:hypothetical protein n=1 Tax=Marinobacter persicus TaxID=930118 RepID=UPI001C436195|nr:hypothetical protein [Marinobacter persicus]